MSNAEQVLRMVRRSAVLAMTIAIRLAKAPGNGLAAQASWTQATSRAFLNILSAGIESHGRPTGPALLAGNHVSYVDILVLASLFPAVFVAKADVRGWPIFGRLTKAAGTIFIRRERRAEVAGCLRRIEAVRSAGLPVVVFPEGTSSDGTAVLPFHSSLLEGACREGRPVVPFAIRYEVPCGEDPGKVIAYWGDMHFGPHLLRLLGLPGFRAILRFGEPVTGITERKVLAEVLRQEVARLLRESRAAA